MKHFLKKRINVVKIQKCEFNEPLFNKSVHIANKNYSAFSGQEFDYLQDEMANNIHERIGLNLF
jgi:hypothetical protein